MAKAASLEKALELKAGTLEKMKMKEKMDLFAIQTSQAELDRLKKVVVLQEEEMQKMKQLVSTIVKKCKEPEKFFHEALDHVKKQIAPIILRYKTEGLQEYHRRFREATAGKIKFPPIRTFHKSPHSTNFDYSDMDRLGTMTCRSVVECYI